MRAPRLISGIPPSHQAITVGGEVRASVEIDPYFSLRAASAYSGLSVRSLRTWLVHPNRPLPCYRVGGKILLRRSEVDRWLAGFRRCGRADVDAVVDQVLSELARTA